MLHLVQVLEERLEFLRRLQTIKRDLIYTGRKGMVPPVQDSNLLSLQRTNGKVRFLFFLENNGKQKLLMWFTVHPELAVEFASIIK